MRISRQNQEDHFDWLEECRLDREAAARRAERDAIRQKQMDRAEGIGEKLAAFDPCLELRPSEYPTFGTSTRYGEWQAQVRALREAVSNNKYVRMLNTIRKMVFNGHNTIPFQGSDNLRQVVELFIELTAAVSALEQRVAELSKAVELQQKALRQLDQQPSGHEE